jgi:hypothetical protein
VQGKHSEGNGEQNSSSVRLHVFLNAGYWGYSFFLTPHEFNGERLKRLVREAIEQEKISLGRGAEILGTDLADMRKLAASWVE